MYVRKKEYGQKGKTTEQLHKHLPYFLSFDNYQTNKAQSSNERNTYVIYSFDIYQTNKSTVCLTFTESSLQIKHLLLKTIYITKLKS